MMNPSDDLASQAEKGQAVTDQQLSSDMNQAQASGPTSRPTARTTASAAVSTSSRAFRSPLALFRRSKRSPSPKKPTGASEKRIRRHRQLRTLSKIPQNHHKPRSQFLLPSSSLVQFESNSIPVLGPPTN